MTTLEPIPYADGPTALTGQLARPAGIPRAAVVVFPTIMNQAENALRRLPMLAEAGCLALCADLYGRAPADVDAALAIMRRKRGEAPRDGDEV